MVAFTFTVLLLMLLLRVISVKEFPNLTIKNKITQELCSAYKKKTCVKNEVFRKKCNQHKVLDSFYMRDMYKLPLKHLI